MSEHRLSVGQTAKVKRGLFTNVAVIYAGAASETTYSIAVLWSSGYNSAAYNLYIHKGQRELTVMGGRLTVLGLSPEEILFRYE